MDSSVSLLNISSKDMPETALNSCLLPERNTILQNASAPMMQFAGTEAEIWQQEMNLPRRGKKQEVTQALTISSTEPLPEQNRLVFFV